MEARIARAEELQVHRIKDLQEGRDLVAEINETSNKTMQEMRADGVGNELHMQLTDLLYEFKKARNNIQSQMTRLVKIKMKSTKN